MRAESRRILHVWLNAIVIYLLGIFSSSISACDLSTSIMVSTPGEVTKFFEREKKKVVTFVGYSGAEYEGKNSFKNK